MPDVSSPVSQNTAPMKPSEVDGVSPHSQAGSSPLAADPASPISPDATGASTPSALSNRPADLKSIIPDAVLDERLAKAGIGQEISPEQREKLRESLFTGLQYAAMPLTDERFLEHADHMGMDRTAIQARMREIGTQALQYQQQGEKTVQRLTANNEEGRRAMTKTVGVALISTVVGSVIPFIKLGKKFAGSMVKRTLASLGLGIASGAIIGTVLTKTTTGGVFKEQQSILKDGQALQTQFAKLDQDAQAYDAEIKEQFLNVHLTRALNGEGTAKEAASPSGHHSAVQGEMKPYVAVADAQGEVGMNNTGMGGQTGTGTGTNTGNTGNTGVGNVGTGNTGVGMPGQNQTATGASSAPGDQEMKAYIPVASAESSAAGISTEAGAQSGAGTEGSTQPNTSSIAPKTATGSNPAVPYTSAAVDNTLPPGSDAPPPWSTYTTKGTGWSTSAEAQAAAESQAAMENQKNMAGSQADVGAGGETPKTSMDAFVNTGPSLEPKSVQTQQNETNRKYNASAEIAQSTASSPEALGLQADVGAAEGRYMSSTQPKNANGFAAAAIENKKAANEQLAQVV